MSRRDSEYDRQPNEAYQTPDWVLECAISHMPWARKIWEPACGEGNLVRVLADHGFDVYATDKRDGEDFFEMKDPAGAAGIVTNPPFADSAVFIQHALDLMEPARGFVFMLLPGDYEFAKSRRNLFAECKIFKRKVELTKRIVWFERDDGERPAPSENHCWCIWDWRHRGLPTLMWAP